MFEKMKTLQSNDIFSSSSPQNMKKESVKSLNLIDDWLHLVEDMLLDDNLKMEIMNSSFFQDLNVEIIHSDDLQVIWVTSWDIRGRNLSSLNSIRKL